MASVSVNIMQFNIEYGGVGVDFRSVGQAIQAANADVVAIQEGCGRMAEVADSLDWPFFDHRTQIVSRFPLLNPGSGDGEPVFVEVEPGRVVAIINVHPPSRSYGPNRLARGVDPKVVMRRERRVRLGALAHSLAAAEKLMDSEIPVLLLGDFNAPSHRDWTVETVGLRSHVNTEFAWPMSAAAEDLGLVDVYRSHFPDPVTHQGLTWPADRPFVEGYNPARSGQAADRIDLMFASARARSSSVRLVGEGGSEYSDIVVDPWPTDHRAIVASFDVELGPVPTVLSPVHELSELGPAVDVRYHAVGAGAHALVAARQQESGEHVFDRLPSQFGGVVSVSTNDLGPGRFELHLRGEGGRQLASAPLWVRPEGTTATVNVDKQTYVTGEPVRVSWDWAPGNRSDWVAVFERGADPSFARRKVWAYTGATVEGSRLLDGVGQPRWWPLPPGEYTAHLLLDDLTASLASADFSVLPN